MNFKEKQKTCIKEFKIMTFHAALGHLLFTPLGPGELEVQS
jgi:hypothetical protein